MFIEDYISTVAGSLVKMGSSKAVTNFSFPLHELKVEDLTHSDPNTYKNGSVVLDRHKTISFRSYVGAKGKIVELVCHGEFDHYSFWEYEDLDDEGVQKLKSRIPGSSHVKLVGHANKVQEQLKELISELRAYELVLKKRKAKRDAKR